MTEDMTEAERTQESGAPAPATGVSAEDVQAASVAGTADADTANADADTAARIAALESKVAELEVRVQSERDAATDYMNRWQRAQADFSNFKRRTQAEQEQRDTVAAARVIAMLLPALDSFERAFASLPETLRGFSWIDGVALVDLQLRRTLDAHEVRPIAVEPGSPFDPQRHQSIGEVESETLPAGSVAVVVQQGYESRGLVLRPALVQLACERVSAPPATEAPHLAASTSPPEESIASESAGADSG